VAFLALTLSRTMAWAERLMTELSFSFECDWSAIWGEYACECCICRASMSYRHLGFKALAMILYGPLSMMHSGLAKAVFTDIKFVGSSGSEFGRAARFQIP
jgi:hypothetical protein